MEIAGMLSIPTRLTIWTAKASVSRDFAYLPREISHVVRTHNNTALTPVAHLKGNRTCGACQMDAKVENALFQALMPRGVSEGWIRDLISPYRRILLHIKYSMRSPTSTMPLISTSTVWTRGTARKRDRHKDYLSTRYRTLSAFITKKTSYYKSSDLRT